MVLRERIELSTSPLPRERMTCRISVFAVKSSPCAGRNVALCRQSRFAQVRCANKHSPTTGDNDGAESWSAWQVSLPDGEVRYYRPDQSIDASAFPTWTEFRYITVSNSEPPSYYDKTNPPAVSTPTPPVP